jgi:hypothetical protein
VIGVAILGPLSLVVAVAALAVAIWQGRRQGKLQGQVAAIEEARRDEEVADRKSALPVPRVEHDQRSHAILAFTNEGRAKVEGFVVELGPDQVPAQLLFPEGPFPPGPAAGRSRGDAGHLRQRPWCLGCQAELDRWAWPSG